MLKSGKQFTIKSLTMLASIAVLTDLLVSPPPVFGQSVSIPLYLPYSSSALPNLQKELDTLLQRADSNRFKVQSADYWHPYQQGLRHGRVGVYLAAPHFASWAIHKHQFVPISLKFVIAARKDDARFFEINDLANHSICAQKAVNLDFLLVKSALSNPLLSANNKSVNSVSDAMKYDNENCHAFAVSDHLFQKFNLESPDRFIRLQQGQQFNNYVFIAHPEVSQDHIERLTVALKSEEVRHSLAPLYEEFSTQTKLIPAAISEYPLTYTSALKAYWGE